MSLSRLLLGRTLANREMADRKIGAFEGVPAMGLDGLGSSAYGPEAALTVFIPLGAAGLGYIGWIMAPIVGLLAILFLSYWQTIRAYPSNGGAYVVSKENLGPDASLLAAAALMIDYVLNVAVGISAGVGALVSAVPALHPYILPLCLGTLALITIVNLRGTLESSRLFAVPTYLFIASFTLVLAIGVWRAVATGAHPSPVIAPPALPPASGAVSLWLLLRAFAAGCTAMTGVEAVSNGMGAFRDPPTRNGHRTLAAIVGVLGVLLVGIAYLATRYRIGAMDQTRAGYQSVLSQLAHATVGAGPLYGVAIASLLCVLALSANTSFVGFPRLCQMVAEDGYLPKPFAVAGRRLVFSVGILYLAATSGVLLLAFGGITDRLIPLFAIGAFLTFTLSQLGMVVHWRRDSGANRRQLFINTVGAATTLLALAVIVIAKFTEGAWITILVIPCVIVLLKLIHGYYAEVAARLRDPGRIAFDDITPPVVLVTMHDWNKVTDKALRLAMSLSPDVIAVHLSHLSGPDADEKDRLLREAWKRDVECAAEAAGRAAPRLVILQAEYRTIHEPVLKLAAELKAKLHRDSVAVMIPELVKQHWYQHLLHSHRGGRLRAQLLRYGGGQITMINVPWRLDPTPPMNARS